MVLVFVYGTLKVGLPNHYILKDEKNGIATFVSSGATTERFPLIVTTEFAIPMLLNKRGTGEFVDGEVYEVDDVMLAKLDELENNGKLYLRTKVDICCNSNREGSPISCDAYLINDFLEDLLNLPLLKSYSDASKYVSPREKQRKLEDVVAVVKHS